MPSTINRTLPVQNSPMLSNEMRQQFGRAADDIDALQTGKANLASPALTGTPTAPTAAAATNTTQLATTAFVRANAVTNLQGNAVAAGAPATGQILQWTGSNWAPTTATGGVPDPTMVAYRPMTPDIANWVPVGSAGVFVAEGNNIRNTPGGRGFFTAYTIPGPPHQLRLEFKNYNTGQVMQMYRSSIAPAHTQWDFRWNSWWYAPITNWGNWDLVQHLDTDAEFEWDNYQGGTIYWRTRMPGMTSGGYLGPLKRRRYIAKWPTDMEVQGETIDSSAIVFRHYQWSQNIITGRLPPNVTWLGCEEIYPNNPQGRCTVRYSTQTGLNFPPEWWAMTQIGGSHAWNHGYWGLDVTALANSHGWSYAYWYAYVPTWVYTQPEWEVLHEMYA